MERTAHIPPALAGKGTDPIAENLGGTLTASLGEHREAPVILLHFPYDRALIAAVRKLPGAKWSSTLKAWHVPDNGHYRQYFGLPLRTLGKQALARTLEVNRPALQRLVETIRLKGYSPNTETTYRNEFAQLLHALGERPVDTLTPDDLRAYMLHCAQELRLSEAMLHSRLNAIKFYFEQVLGREKTFVDIPRPKKHSTLPKHISPRDVKKLLDGTTNLKHNTMLRLCYGMGLRVSELVNLKLGDIDSGNMQVHVRRAKGKKDRYVNLPQSVLGQLREYFKAYRPKEYLFQGQYGGALSVRSAQAVFQAALKRAGIKKQVGIHGLRHSYATHLMVAGTDIGHIQKLLGHEDIRTTLIYAKVSGSDLKKVKSPLDNL